MNNSLQQTRDSIGSNPNIIPIPIITSEKVSLYEEPTFIYERSIGNSWIVGSPTNGIVGTWTGTVGGGQQVVGASSNTETFLRMVPPNDTYVNWLRSTLTNTSGYGLSSSIGTAIDTNNFRIDLNSGDFYQWYVCLNHSSTIKRATVYFNTDPSRTNMDFSSNSGLILYSGTSGGQAVQNGVEHIMTSADNTLLLALIGSANNLYWKTKNTNGFEVPIIVKLVT